VNTKLAVHWAPFVNVITPGWIAAVSAGAQTGTAAVGVAFATVGAAALTSTARPRTSRTRRTRLMSGYFDGLPVTPSL
jgi:hypothetical protein